MADPAYPGQPPPAQALPPGYSNPQASNYSNPHAGAWYAGPPPQYSHPAGGHPPPPPGYGAPPSHQSTTVVVAQPAVRTVGVIGGGFGQSPVCMTCPTCQATITTSTQYETGTMTWVIAGVLCLVGCVPWCLIPFCVSGCKDVVHFCPNCRAQLGRYNRM